MKFVRFAATALLAAATLARADIAQRDLSFGSNGTVIEPPPCIDITCTSAISKIARQPDGKVLVLMADGRNGGFHGEPYAITPQLTRYLVNGTRDPDFGVNGLVQVPIDSRQSGQDFIHLDGAIAVQPDGRILVAAQQIEPCPSTFCNASVKLARLMPDGSLDNSFGNAGFVTNVGGLKAIGLGVQATGRIVVATDGMRLAAFTSTGAPDLTYGNGGVANVAIAYHPFYTYGFVMDADGSVTLGASQAELLELARVNAAGQLDASFYGGDGRASLAARSGDNLRGRTLVVFPGGRVVLGGLNGFLWSILPDGNPDPAFGANGIRDYGQSLDITGLDLDAGGRLLGVGLDFGTIHILRWLPNGDPDLSLRGTGKVATPAVTGTLPSLRSIPGAQALVQHGNRVTRMGVVNAFEDNGQFVRQQYRDFLAREPDQAGVDYWTARLATDLTRAQLLETFINSPEFGQTIAPIARLYFSYFMRFPDYGGLAYWAGRYRGGESLEGISQLFAQSAEFGTRYGTLADEQFVVLVYQNVLGRTPDSNESFYWRGRLATGMTRGQMMLAFSESAEFRSLSYNEVYVATVYAGMLRRAPDQQGFAAWVGYMDRGNSGLALIDAFLSSQEYINRIYQ